MRLAPLPEARYGRVEILDVVERAGTISSLAPHELLRTMKVVDDCAMLASSSGVLFEILCRLTLAPTLLKSFFPIVSSSRSFGIAAVFKPPQISTQIRQNYPVAVVITQRIWEMSESRSIQRCLRVEKKSRKLAVAGNGLPKAASCSVLQGARLSVTLY
jgi:hypothetical protein